jgi:hypothetical protein
MSASLRRYTRVSSCRRSSLIRMFSGFRSLCQTFASCAARTPASRRVKASTAAPGVRSWRSMTSLHLRSRLRRLSTVCDVRPVPRYLSATDTPASLRAATAKPEPPCPTRLIKVYRSKGVRTSRVRSFTGPLISLWPCFVTGASAGCARETLHCSLTFARTPTRPLLMFRQNVSERSITNEVLGQEQVDIRRI